MTHIFGITYGRSKVGKTLALVRAFPDGLFIGPPGALTCAKWLDWEPQVLSVTRKQGFKFLADTIKKASGKFPAIIIDDLSLIADAELEQCKKVAPGYAAFDLFNKKIYDLRDAAREASSHVFFTCHEQAPREVKKDQHNRYIPGAPLIPGWQAPEKLPAMVDFCARVIHDEDAPGWPFVYATGPDQNYIQGDRLAILPARFPLNLREAMLGAGIDVPRPKALAWMDEYVEATAQDLQEQFLEKTPDFQRVLKVTARTIQEHSPRHVRWVLADAMDRMVLRRHTSNLLTDFIGNY
tara:strand:+ start:10665 stop:11549 length:885 start_codon:yes stop_codon:yes gene_type:complete